MRALRTIVKVGLRRAVLAACAGCALMFGAAQAVAYDSGTVTSGNPLAGHPWFVDVHWGVLWRQARAWQNSHPDSAKRLMYLAQEPSTKSFGAFEPNPRVNLRAYLERAQTEDPGSIPMISLSRIAHQSCPYVEPSADYQPPAYKRWVTAFADALGNFRVMVLVEPDRIPTMPCLPRSAQNTRYALLQFDMTLLHTHRNAIVYLDAGASDWTRSTSDLARRLTRAGVAYGQGFALNASHFDTTAHNIAYGLKVSKQLGGRHFIINTDANGTGPISRSLSASDGGCQPPNIGVGLSPTVRTHNPLIDAFVWLDTPGFAPGTCIGHPTGGYTFYPDLALKMERNANPPFPR